MDRDGGSSLVSEKYAIVRALGRGGMGEVYLATDTRLNRRVAIKYLRGDLPEGDWRERLRREAQLLAQLNHPNIVQIYDIVEQDGIPALVMEYVDGRNLLIHLREHRVDLGERLRWLTEIAAGVAASHEQGIVHCDLKLENVLISPSGTAKVSDFGIASDNSDAGDDMAALGRVAEAVLADYRDALSPLLRELLADLNQVDPAHRPTAREAAERFRLAWYENSQEETPLPDSVASAAPTPRWRGFAAVLAAGLLVAALVALLMQPATQATRYVAVAPTHMDSGSAIAEQQARYLRTAVLQSLRQQVVDSPGLTLVSYQQEDLAVTDPSALLATLGVESLILSSLSCNDTTCEFTVERLDAPDAAVSAQASTTLLLDSVLSAASYLDRQWPEFFPEARLASRGDSGISEDQYRAYLDLYLDAEQARLSHADLVFALEVLLAQVDDYAPLYLLYASAAVDAYEFMGDEGYLDRLDEQLTIGSRRVADPASLDRAWFDLYRVRGDIDNAARRRAAIVARDPDPALDSFLGGELEAAARNFQAAVPLFASATSLQPSSRHYYAWARSLYYAKDKQQALDVLEQMLTRYPFNTTALNLKGAILFEQWQLDAAAATFEQSLGTRDDAVLRSNLGSIYLFLGDYALANAHFEAAYASQSRDSAMLLNLADSEKLLGNTQRADTLYGELVRRFEQQDLSILPEVAAQSYAQLGLYEQALTVIRQYEVDSEGHATYAFYNALVYTLAGQKITALVEVGEALSGGLPPGFFSLPWFDALCDQPRFVELLTEAGDTLRCSAAAERESG